MTDFKYVGSELGLFANVRNWKAYWSGHVRPLVRGDVLEVGAGLGANTRWLDPGAGGRWVCLEPDPELTIQLQKNLDTSEGNRRFAVTCGTLADLDSREMFDTIVYIDVLEHIEDDGVELGAAAARLRPGGRLIILVPAYPWLFAPFDAAIGHFRRYNRSMIRKISPRGLLLENILHLDSVGLTASTANLLFLRQSMPTAAQLRIWDRWMIPASRVLDKLLFYSVGKSILAVWQKR